MFLSLADSDKPAGLVVAKRLRELGLGIAATQGTADYLARFGKPVDQVVGKVSEGDGQTAVDLIADGKVTLRRQHARGPAAAAPTASRSARPPTCTGSAR